LGDEVAAALLRSLADLEAVDAITELPWLPVVIGTEGEASIEFYPGYSLNVVAVRGVVPASWNQDVDWTVVDRVKLVGIIQP
jgi:hypothetical protein